MLASTMCVELLSVGTTTTFIFQTTVQVQRIMKSQPKEGFQQPYIKQTK